MPRVATSDPRAAEILHRSVLAEYVVRQRPINHEPGHLMPAAPIAARKADDPRAIPAGLPVWVTAVFIDETIRVWQPHSKKALGCTTVPARQNRHF